MDGTIQRNDEMKQEVDSIYAPHRKMLKEVVGVTKTDLNRYAGLICWDRNSGK
jgi:2',3'-cyclic-nucleotide 2'-phosphodiesterase (5'-nucleotidase family)